MSAKLRFVTVVAVSTVALAAAAGVRPVAGSRSTHSLSVAMVSGQRYLAAREMQIDLEFPDGKTGRGRLYLLFEPVSGLYLHNFAWERDSYPTYDFIGHVEAHGRVGTTDDRLFIAFFVDGVGILDSTEKAASMDDAETRSLKWYADHLSQVEDRSDRGQHG